MKNLLSNLKIEIPSGIYIKDPETSDLGKRIIENSIILIEEIGFENFNFKKLGKLIGSNESSIYRYFESKHKLLVYLTSWYWGWIQYLLVIETYSISNPKEKLIKAIEVLARKAEKDNNFSHINEALLNLIVINENSKSYSTKEVDTENKEGFFKLYKEVVKRFAEIISNYNNNYKHPLTLASTIIEGILHQQFVKSHFKSLTNCDKSTTTTSFFIELTLNVLSNEREK
ncbi:MULTISPECIES: TetR/AcrR family transcriptional regulator [Tenacibaculum]|uniref:TetR/AcrR family transcriptional regulator n=1 Tax=Tenacibaculum mesophilum TaxID=104268 RepID=A0AAE9MS35_9FLAO|nr:MULTISPECIES: TetR/AcrR family transcriptional regulator [Tenacibaculum]AZJ31139.1 TetR/AcrR family transcriptional regulator [Tenacibaculum mesophilum]MCG7501572.1 TetR/AcrR family transcriptional regulator [Tenacibaculum sp. Mcav3-52]QFS29185.1 TetR family transcriptional regulator [Tenacibaculum mesophilum]UTD16613.1 TetR/AcrR family transcriptional regulator [Tenacibaculum mesophilum]SHF51131.1 transcriptional regulator, TetR family [Tenacibaculum mesophilum]